MKGMLKVVGWGFGILVGLILAVIGIGYLIPQDHTASAELTVRGSPTEVFATITDVESMPAWRPGVERTERLADVDGLPVWRESGPNGTLTLQVIQLEPPTLMRTRIADEGLPFGGTWTYALDEAPGGTRVTLTEEGEIYNPVFRFVSRFILGYDTTMRAYLAGLEERMARG